MKLSLSDILETIKGIATQLAPFVPYAQWAIVGTAVVESVVGVFRRAGTKVTDENGTVLSPEELSARALETWNRIDAKLAAIGAKADAEIGKVRGTSPA